MKTRFSLFKIEKKSRKFKIYFLGIPLFSKENNTGSCKISVLGIPFYVQIVDTTPNKKNEIVEHIQNLAYLSYKYAYLPSIVAKHHQKHLVPFKNKHLDKEIVICGTGPSFNYYAPLPAIHLGLNRAYENEKIKFDYLFAWDMPNLMKNDATYYDKVKAYPAQKIFGRFLCEEIEQVNDKMAQELNAITLYSSARHGLLPAPYDETIHYDIEVYPLMDFGSCAFGAFHFALYTGVKRIYLVGIDNSLNGYFNPNHKQWFLSVDMIHHGWLKVKDFMKIYYPDVEVISVNPVGLKGVFKDVYTSSYVEAHPEIDKNDVEVL